MNSPREIILNRLKKDLLGPFDGESEVIDYSNDGPDKEYFSGKIYPQNEEPDQDVLDELVEENSGKDISNSHHEETNAPKSRIFSSGLTFYCSGVDGKLQLSLTYNFGVYSYNEVDELWNRKQITNVNNPCIFSVGIIDSDGEIAQASGLHEGLTFYYKTRVYQEDKKKSIAISVFAVNENKVSDEDSFRSRQEKIFFQFGFSLKAINGEIISIPRFLNPLAEDNTNDFLYRDKKTYAIGHGCSAAWSDENTNLVIRTEWFPEYFVPDMTSSGHKSLKEVNLDAVFLSKEPSESIVKLLINFIDKYEEWIGREASFSIKKNKDFDAFNKVLIDQVDRAKKHIERMRRSVNLLKNNKNALEAFKMANEALSIQYQWSDINLVWRPFQMGFLLISLESTLIPESPGREEVDLLWFPTGGGKTEAYLFLSSILLFFRKLEKGSLSEEDGLAIISRYTMRALTIDQFKRMAGTILACEQVRRTHLKNKGISPKEKDSFSIGMWVGKDSTPNSFSELNKGADNVDFKRKNLAVMTQCPCCQQNLEWHSDKRPGDYRPVVLDKNNTCVLSRTIKHFPIMVIDEQIYANPPSAIVGTIDKFVQIIKRPEDAQKIFAVSTNSRKPDLIIQDELHLISGPLGSISALIEILIEEYTSEKKYTPKVVGSTATIQRAEEQIKSLYSKPCLQFPVNISSADDSFFAQTDFDSTGRIYLGITSGSSTSTYMLQALCGILLQSLKDKKLNSFKDDEIDPYSTIVAYFNTLRVLSGSKVSLQDDTVATIEALSEKHNENQYDYEIPEELTSANSQDELRDIMDRLSKDFNQDGSISILLASVMISVGLDISRLGLMVVDGQPKSIAEYIQATSRVGRGKIPGLVITLFNNYKPRDKSYYETFINWHNSLYRFVESTGVTPFSARARQKIFPALVTSLALKKLNRTRDNFAITVSDKKFIEKNVKPIILNKINYLDPLEAKEAEEEIDKIIDRWIQRGPNIKYLSNDMDELNSLLISAEAQVAKKASDFEGDIAFPAPNSAREVEPSVRIKAYKALKHKFLDA